MNSRLIKISEAKKGQAGIEYLIIIGFATFAVISTLLIAYYYSGMARDRIILNQVEVFASKLIKSSESVFYAGEPSLAYISVYLPSQVKSIEITDYDVIITTLTSSGESKQAFSSNAKLQGSINPSEGIKRIKLQATSDRVVISQQAA
ncbi:MAG TPA: hypothetical protein VJA86_00750 [Candidatus Nanoarchaeia archaeon]|nr:hypothetical protein [Candidatus Nanoarchaeia archaeon]